jgi:hypothetical protein
MVERVLRVLLNDRALRIQCQDLKGRAEGVEEDGEEQQRASLVEAVRGRLYTTLNQPLPASGI